MMAHAFGLDVTAEGVETPEQLQVLRELGIANAQGYLFSRPSPAADIEALLRGTPRSTADYSASRCSSDPSASTASPSAVILYTGVRWCEIELTNPNA